MKNKIKNYSLFNNLDKTLFFFIILLLIYSVVLIWSASNQNFDLIKRKIIQIIIGLIIMFLLSKVKPSTYLILAPYLYIFCIILLLTVNLFGQMTKGAQRWLDFGYIRFQPSEITKIAVPLMLARFISINNNLIFFKEILIALILIIIPTMLVLMQPDLGTAILIAMSGLFVIFLSGVSYTFIFILLLLVGIFTPILWFFVMHDYQKNRIMILFNPEQDPLGSGYHIIQSKIAIGSGGLLGKGWLKGTQSQLEFLPERHTDFIFAVLGEEFGFIGVLILMFLYIAIISRGIVMALSIQNNFNRVIIGSLMLVFFVYVFVNIGMVGGILPIVGIPLPIISYGGSALIVIMSGFGIIMSMYSNR